MADLIQTTVIERPDCSVCKAESPSSKPNPAIYDGKTVMGTREYMCRACFEVVGISSGPNQQLIVEGAPSGSISKLYLAVSDPRLLFLNSIAPSLRTRTWMTG